VAEVRHRSDEYGRLQNRVDVLERTVRSMQMEPRAQRTTLVDVRIAAGGYPVIDLGTFDADGVVHPGVAGYARGVPIIAWGPDIEGLIYPHAHQAGAWLDQSVALTSIVTRDLWMARVNQPAHDTFVLEVAVDVDPGTTGELTLTDGTVTTSPVVVDAVGVARFAWLHPWAVGWGDTGVQVATLVLQGHRTGGFGAVTVWPPRLAMWASHSFTPDAASGGAPQLIEET
jgi:hypothetical protein